MISSEINWSLTCLQPFYEFPLNDNIAKAMNNFVREHAVDMVAVIPHEHDLIEKMFTRSVTKDIVFHTHVPLLILPASHTYKAGSESKVLRDKLHESV
ncbi:MAG: universal stress protein [Segetibacter sp.]